jgi:hypothetical protein
MRKNTHKIAWEYKTSALMHEERRRLEQYAILRDARSIIRGIADRKITYEVGIEAHRHNMRMKHNLGRG